MLFRVVVLAILAATAVLPASAQQLTVTADDYGRAEDFLSSNTAPFVFGATVRPTWLPGDRLWYRNTIPDGAEFVLADPATGSRTRAFDHARLAQALSAVVDTTYEAGHLPFLSSEFADQVYGKTRCA